MYCELSPIQGSQGTPIQRCIHCGQLYTIDKDFLVESTNCPEPNRQKQLVPLPNILKRFLKYAKTYAHYIATGQQQCPLPVLVDRFQICSRCDYYNDLEGACAVCGCYVNLSSSDAMPNKALWAIESCPLNPPKWKSVVSKSSDPAVDT